MIVLSSSGGFRRCRPADVFALHDVYDRKHLDGISAYLPTQASVLARHVSGRAFRAPVLRKRRTRDSQAPSVCHWNDSCDCYRWRWRTDEIRFPAVARYEVHRHRDCPSLNSLWIYREKGNAPISSSRRHGPVSSREIYPPSSSRRGRRKAFLRTSAALWRPGLTYRRLTISSPGPR